MIVEHLKSADEDQEHEKHVPVGCNRDKHGQPMCPSDLYSVFPFGSSCFRVDQKFVCEEDLEHISKSMCINIQDYHVCGPDLLNLFHGQEVLMHDGHKLLANFATENEDHHSALCRDHEGIEFCLERVLDLYQAPHDCVMFGGEWLCQDEMIHAWKEGCIDINGHRICGPTMVDIVLQSCVEIQKEHVCPTAVGTKRNGYS